VTILSPVVAVLVQYMNSEQCNSLVTKQGTVLYTSVSVRTVVNLSSSVSNCQPKYLLS